MDDLENIPEWAQNLLNQVEENNRLMREIQAERTESKRKADEENQRKADAERQLHQQAEEWAKSLPDAYDATHNEPHYTPEMTAEEMAEEWAKSLPDA